MDEPGQVFDDQTFDVDIKKQALYWQKVLSLQDWNLEIKVCRQWEMSDASTLAQCKWFIHRKDAVIQVLHPSDLPGLAHKFLGGEENDYDISLVHELLHLHFAPLNYTSDDNKYYEIAEEQAINAISRGIVKLYRTPQSPGTDAKSSTNHGHYI